MTLIQERLDCAGVYQIRNLINSHIYIGSAINLRTRRNRHFSELILNHHHNNHLQRAFNSYGKEHFIFEKLIECHPDMIIWYEQQFLDKWKPEYNQRKDATKNTNIRHSDEYKKKVSEQFKGTKLTKEHILKRDVSRLIHSMEIKPMLGIRQASKNLYTVNFKHKYLGCYKNIEDAQNVFKKHAFEYIKNSGVLI